MASTKIYLDKRHKTSANQYYVKLRVTHNRETRYYPTNIKLTEEDFKRVMFAQKRTAREKELSYTLNSFDAKAIEAKNKIPYFTFEQFEKRYIANRGATDSVECAFNSYISELRSEERISYASNYQTAFSSINKFKSGLRFVDITPSFLRSYEAWMKSRGKSITGNTG